MEKQIFVNLAVNNIKDSMEFFTKLGFSFNPKYTDENAACMIIEKNIFVMLLNEKFFEGFIPGRELCKTITNSEVLLAVSLENREKVDKIIEDAIDAGGKEFREKTDYGWMYSRAFEDLDGHIWEMVHSDESKMENNEDENEK